MDRSTIKEIAERTNLSTSTVSLSLRDSHKVKEDTKKLVLSIANELNYKRNLLGRAFNLQKTDTIGIVTTDIGNIMATKSILNVEAIFNERGYHVILGNTQGILEKEIEYVNLLSQGKTDGLMIGSIRPDYEHIEGLIFHNFPFVLVDKYEDQRVNYVTFNDKKGAYLATEHMIRLGHKRIGYISGPSMTLTNKHKLDGYKQALEHYNFYFDGTLVVEGGYNPRDGYQAVQKILDDKNRPTAIFCFNDRLAVGVMKGLEELGIRVPGEIAIVGFDNSEDEFFGLNVPLTTISFNQNERDKKATEILLDKIENPDDLKEPVHIELEPELIIRKSCGFSSVNGK